MLYLYAYFINTVLYTHLIQHSVSFNKFNNLVAAIPSICTKNCAYISTIHALENSAGSNSHVPPNLGSESEYTDLSVL